MPACAGCGATPGSARASRSRGRGGLRSAALGCRSGSSWWPASFGGALIGYALDRWLETWPICFLVMFFLGAAAGMLNAYRHIRRWSELPEERSKDR